MTVMIKRESDIRTMILKKIESYFKKVKRKVIQQVNTNHFVLSKEYQTVLIKRGDIKLYVEHCWNGSFCTITHISITVSVEQYVHIVTGICIPATKFI